MKQILTVFCCLAMAACSTGRYGSGVPVQYHALLDAALAKTNRAEVLRNLIADAPKNEQEGFAYLISYMPVGDLDTMDLNLLRENVEYAYRAKAKFPWTEALPDSIFWNEVLPYAAVDEVRDSWRKDFFDLFSRRVEGCNDMQAAIDSVNRHICADVQVEYNTLREKTNQSPAESMRQGMASCTGLSILLVDAFRSVGIPARFAGTPAWHDDRGNHSWVEVWIDGEWYFTEYYPTSLNRSWFLADAGKADPADPAHGIYAVSFRPTGDSFPMVWSEGSTTVPGENVSPRYISVCRVYEDGLVAQGTHVRVAFRMYRHAAHTRQSGDRVAANVDVFCGTEQVGGGRTASPTQDMNDDLIFLLEKKKSYTFRYENARGKAVSVLATVGDLPTIVTGSMN